MNESTGATPAATSENLLGARIVGGLIDFVVIVIIGVVMTLLFGDTESDDGSFEFGLSGAPFIVYILISLGYYFVLENSKGQTLGKMVMGLKVVSTAGPMTPGKIAVRTLLRIVDGFFFYLVAVIAIAASKEHQRIGDMAAGTNVVRAPRDTQL
jgi:uncharacterized RDD family membrane protein YckC